MKKLNNVIWLFGMLFLFCSCASVSTNPNDYEAEIQDDVRFEIAMLQYFDGWWEDPAAAERLAVYALENAEEIANSEYTDEDAAADYYLDMLYEALDALYVGEDLSWKETLERVSQDNGSDFQADAKGMLAMYKTTQISLSDYKPASTRDNYKSWIFTELSSGIKFVFEITDLNTEKPLWTCFMSEME